MKYKNWYIDIIQNAESQDREKGQELYFEEHHILPRSLGGSNDKSNLVLLTLREHFIAHALLYRFTTGSDKIKMTHAWRFMSNTGKYTSRLYEKSKIEFSFSEETKKKMSEWHKNKKLTDEHKKNISKSMLGDKNHRYKIIPSEETKRKFSLSRKGKYNGNDHHDSKLFMATSPIGVVYRGVCLKTFSLEHNFPASTCKDSARKKRVITRGPAAGWSFLYI